MEQVLQFVLYATIAVVVSCYPHTGPDMPTEVEDSIGSADTYPAEYINKLKAALSPEELEKYFPAADTEVDHRISPSKTCKFSKRNKTLFQSQSAEDDETEYFIAHPTQYEIEICDPLAQAKIKTPWPIRNSCELEQGDISLVGCCMNTINQIEVTVLNVPVDVYTKRAIKENNKDGFAIKMVYFKNKCDCIGEAVRKSQIGNYVCAMKPSL